MQKRFKKAKTAQEKDEINETLKETKQAYLNLLENKTTAANIRIKNFYWKNSGKMTSTTFQCVSEKKKSLDIHSIEHEQLQHHDFKSIANIMQLWYQNTTNSAHTQTTSLANFLMQHDITLPHISEEQVNLLEAEFTADELNYALKDSNPKSASGPTGQSVTFYKLINRLFPDLLLNALNQFSFVPGLSDDSPFEWMRTRKIIYIPKVDKPISPGDYRPLSMLEIFYKLASRILARRLTSILHTVISHTQHGFTPQKGIQEPIFLASQVIQDANRRSKALQLISFDINKAFDKVSHTVIKQAMAMFGIPTIAIQAVERLALYGFARVEVNGQKGTLFSTWAPCWGEKYLLRKKLDSTEFRN